MLEDVLHQQKERKSILILVLFSSLFFIVYTILDYLNVGYRQMIFDYGFYLVILQILLNLILSILSGLMWSMSTSFVKLSGKGDRGSHATFLSLLFGLFTYGCTPCLVAFFATIGITLSIVALPLAGLPYKLISLFILILGFLYLTHEIKHPKCKRPKQKE